MNNFSSRQLALELDDGGVSYLQSVQFLLPDALTMDVIDNLRDRVSIYRWIGRSIDNINRLLQSHLNACHQCFNVSDRRSIQILAVPFASSVRLDGFCNISTNPISILVDVGRVAPPDWLALVAHEYAHAHLGYQGHDQNFARVLGHLCLGLGLPQPPVDNDRSLYYWPPYQPTLDPSAFWRGE